MALLTAGMATAYAVSRQEHPQIHQRQPLAKGVVPKHQTIREADPNAPTTKRSKKASSLSGRAGEAQDLWGYLGYYDDPNYEYPLLGMNAIGADGSYSLVWPDWSAQAGMPMQAGYIRDGRFCGYLMVSYFGEILGLYHKEMDLNTGESVSDQEFTSLDRLYITAAYVPSTDELYGYSYTADGAGYNFTRTDASAPLVSITTIKEGIDAELCLALCYNEYEDVFVGLNMNSDLVEIDRFGNQNVLMERPMGAVANYLCGLSYSPTRDAYLYNAIDYEGSHLYSLQPSSGICERLASFDANEEFFTFHSFDKDDDSPAAPTMKEIDWENGATSGSVVWTLPLVTRSGESLAAELPYEALLDGEPVDIGSGMPGAEIRIECTDVAEGNHTLSMRVNAEGHPASRSNIAMYIGVDIPAAPEDVTLDESTVNWTPVTSGVNGGYIPVEEIEYEVWVDGLQVAVTSETSAPSGIDPESPLSRHEAYVTAKCAGKASAPGMAEPIICGRPYDIPVSFGPTLEESYLFQILDRNHDTYPWFYYEDENAFAYAWDYTTEPGNYENLLLDGDDWLFLPAVNFDDAEAIYTAYVKAATSGYGYLEHFEMFAGDAPTPEAMVIPIYDSGEFDNGGYASMGGDFMIHEAGTKYIGLHALSTSMHDMLTVKDMSIDKVGSIHGPESAEVMGITAAPFGDLWAEVKVKLPSTTYCGEELNPDEDLTLTVMGAAETEATGHAGETVILEVPTAPGDNRLILTVRLADGTEGCPAYATVFTGSDIPSMPSDFRISAGDDNLELSFSWSLSETGVNGGYVDPSHTIYYLCEGSWMDMDQAEMIGTGIEEYTMSLPAGSPLKERWYTIAACDEEGNFAETASAFIQGGVPHALPIIEEFPGWGVTYEPLGATEVDMASYYWYFEDLTYYQDGEYANEKGYALARMTWGEDPFWLALPRFTTMNSSAPVFMLSSYCGQGSAKTNVYARTSPSSERILVGTADGEGWTENVFQLPAELLNQGWVEIDLEFVPQEDFSMAFIDGYEIRDLYDKDLRLCSFQAPDRMIVGQPMTFSGVIQNSGREAIPFPDLECAVTRRGVSAAGTLTSDMPEMLAVGEKVAVEFEVTATADVIGDAYTTLTITSTDLNVSDNALEGRTTVVAARANVVTDLAARESDGDIVLEWSAPLSKGNVGFEEEVHACVDSQLSSFKNLDLDGKVNYGISSIPTPHAGEATGWMVWDMIEIDDLCFEYGEYSFFTVAEGLKAIVAFCPEDGAPANDLLVSPRVKGGSELSFRIAAANSQYGEEILEILYSTTDDVPESFVKFDEVRTDRTSWSKVDLRLPDDCRYFALKYCSADIFGLYLDDIRMETDPSDTDHYEVYRDGMMIGSTGETSFRDANQDFTREMSYNVVPVRADGVAGEWSNTCRIQTSGVNGVVMSERISGGKGCITLRGLENVTVETYTVDGVKVAARTVQNPYETLPMPSGAYVCRAGDNVAKVMVK